MWEVALGDGVEGELMYDATMIEEVRALQLVVKSYTFNFVISSSTYSPLNLNELPNRLLENTNS